MCHVRFQMRVDSDSEAEMGSESEVMCPVCNTMPLDSDSEIHVAKKSAKTLQVRHNKHTFAAVAE